MIRPLYDNVLLKVEEKEETTKSGIILSTKSQDETSFATVVSVGDGNLPDGKAVKIGLKAGDKVIYKKYSTTDIKDGEQKYLLIASKDILAVIA